MLPLFLRLNLFTEASGCHGAPDESLLMLHIPEFGGWFSWFGWDQNPSPFMVQYGMLFVKGAVYHEFRAAAVGLV